MRRRRQKGSEYHFLLLINTEAANYNQREVKRLVSAIRRKQWSFTTEESDSTDDLIARARQACGLDGRRPPQPYVSKRGKVTAIVALGGDGTVNAAAAVAQKADLPLGIIPLGEYNCIARAFNPLLSETQAVDAILGRNYVKTDTFSIGRRLVIGYLSFGFFPSLDNLLRDGSRPLLPFRWAALGSRSAELASPRNLVVKIEAFRFDLKPRLFNINLLPYTLGFEVAGVAESNDGLAEVVFDVGGKNHDLGSFLRQTRNGRYLYGDRVRLFRGNTISVAGLQGQEVLIDGDLVQLPRSDIEIKLGQDQLKVFC